MFFHLTDWKGSSTRDFSFPKRFSLATPLPALDFRRRRGPIRSFFQNWRCFLRLHFTSWTICRICNFLCRVLLGDAVGVVFPLYGLKGSSTRDFSFPKRFPLATPLPALDVHSVLRSSSFVGRVDWIAGSTVPCRCIDSESGSPRRNICPKPGWFPCGNVRAQLRTFFCAAALSLSCASAARVLLPLLSFVWTVFVRLPQLQHSHCLAPALQVGPPTIALLCVWTARAAFHSCFRLLTLI